MQAIQPGHLVLSLFGMANSQTIDKRAQNLSIALNLIGAFIVFLAAVFVLNLVLTSFSFSGFGQASLTQEKTAYLPSQAVSSQLSQGYYLLQ
ncbi:MAG: hypothetical protein WCX71_02275 [Candidatus Buchananbacteria bacterium]